MKAPPSLIIFVPIFNEIGLISQALPRLVELSHHFKSKVLIVCLNIGSTDGSLAALEKFRDNIKVINFPVNEDLGIFYYLKACAKELNADYIMCLPLDVTISVLYIRKVLILIESQVAWGCAFKKYDQPGALLAVYAWVQNQIRTRLLKNFVWTNAPFFSLKILENVEISGFMDDVRLSDALKNKPSVVLNEEVIVSARRYVSDSPARRIFRNLLIIALFRLGFRDIRKLRALYLLK